MGWLIGIGIALSSIGLVGLIASILRVLKARRAGLSDDDLKKAVERAIPLNMGSFALSAFGLMMVVIGLLLT